jgi:nitronate monooxygenase
VNAERAAIVTPLTVALGLRHPVVLAPMAGVSGGALAAAVSRAGGLGLIGGGYGDRDWLEREFAAAGDARVGTGFILWALERQPDLLDLALDRDPAAVFLSFGDFGRFAGRVRRAGIPLILQVQTLAQARAALDAGADILVAQGTEAGGHGGARATLPLVPAVVDIAGEVPVLAAGGIADGRGLAAALMLGAAGALCGTAFYAAGVRQGARSRLAGRMDAPGPQQCVRADLARAGGRDRRCGLRGLRRRCPGRRYGNHAGDRRRSGGPRAGRQTGQGDYARHLRNRGEAACRGPGPSRR